MPKSIPERAELAAPARQLRHRIVATLRAERQNARAALALVTRTPELDFGLRNDVILPRAADLLARKLQLLDEDLRQLAGS
jgi:hypothetical protein